MKLKWDFRILNENLFQGIEISVIIIRNPKISQKIFLKCSNDPFEQPLASFFSTKFFCSTIFLGIYFKPFLYLLNFLIIFCEKFHTEFSLSKFGK